MPIDSLNCMTQPIYEARRISTKFTVAFMLSAIAGFVDAVGYLCLANVFTSHVSGNTVSLGAFAGVGRWMLAAPRILPIPMFMLGVMLGALYSDLSQKKNARRPRYTTTLAIEAMLLAIIGLTDNRFAIGKSQHPLESWRFITAVCGASIAMGMQNATLRRVAGNTVRTTFISGTVADLMEALVALWLSRTGRLRLHERNLDRNRQRARLFTGIYLSFLIGAIFGGYAQTEMHLGAFVVAALALVIIICIDREPAKPPANAPM